MPEQRFEFKLATAMTNRVNFQIIYSLMESMDMVGFAWCDCKSMFTVKKKILTRYLMLTCSSAAMDDAKSTALCE